MKTDRSSVHGDSPGKNTGVSCHALLQGIFPTSELNRGLLNCRWILYQLSYLGSPRRCQSRIQTGYRKDVLSLLHDIWCISWKDSEAGDDWMAGVLHHVEAAPSHMCGDWYWLLAGAPIWLLCVAWGFLIAWWLDSKIRLMVLRSGPGKLHSVTSIVSQLLDSMGKDIQSHHWMGEVFRNFGYT